MRRRSSFVLAALLAIVLLATTAAYAVQVLTVTPSTTSIVYRSPLKLTIASTEMTFSPIALQMRYPGEDWKTIRTVSASRALEATSFPFNVKPRGNAEFKAVQGGVESSVATVSVKALLKRPVLRRTVKAGRSVRIQGWIYPRHAKGTEITVQTYRYSSVSGAYEPAGTITGVVTSHRKGVQASKWVYTWRTATDDKGKWRFVATHEDVMHAPSMSPTARITVR